MISILLYSTIRLMTRKTMIRVYADTYFHNGLDSYLHAITRPNKLLRISENGDITYSIRWDINEPPLMLRGIKYRDLSLAGLP